MPIIGKGIGPGWNSAVTPLRFVHFYVNESTTRIASRNTAYSGTVRYVATTGSDTTGDGTIGNPYATIGKAYTAGSNGDIIQLADGSYNLASETVTAAGYLLLNTANKGMLIRGNAADRTAVTIYHNGTTTYAIRIRAAGELRFENLTISTTSATVTNLIYKDGDYGAQFLKFYNVVFSHTGTGASYPIFKFQAPNLTDAVKHFEFENCEFNRNGGVVIVHSAACASSVFLYKSCTFNLYNPFNYQDGNTGTVAMYDCTFNMLASVVGVQFGADTAAPTQTVGKVDFRGNTIAYAATKGSHAALFGRGTAKVYCVNNTMTVSAISNDLVLGIGIKTIAATKGDAIFAGNHVTAPRPLIIKGGKNTTIKYNTLICNVTNTYAAVEATNASESGVMLYSQSNDITHCNLIGQVAAFRLYTSTADVEVDATMIAEATRWTVDYNNYYTAATLWLYVAYTAAGYTFANRATFWDVATGNDAHSKLLTDTTVTISATKKDV